MEREEEKLEILKECQRQMIKRDIDIYDVFEIGKEVRKKFDIKFEDRTKEEIMEDARKKLI